MPQAVKPGAAAARTRESSFVTLLSGWVQQGIESFIATQRILVDLAVRQNTNVMNLMRDRLANPDICPIAMVTELAGEGVGNFFEAQKLLLGLAEKENEILMTGVKERVSGSHTAFALAELVQRTVASFVEMQQGFLKIAADHTHGFIESVKEGRPLEGIQLVEVARKSIENFVRAQRKLLEAVSEETAHAAGTKPIPRKVKHTEITELARQATEAFIDAEQKLLELAGRQMTANARAATRTIKMVQPLQLATPLMDLTREGVKSFIKSEGELIDSIRKPVKRAVRKARRRRPARAAKIELATV